MDKKICDLCKDEISAIDRIYIVTYGEKSRTIIFGSNIKKGEICYNCCKKIEKYVQSLKEGK